MGREVRQIRRQDQWPDLNQGHELRAKALEGRDISLDSARRDQ